MPGTQGLMVPVTCLSMAAPPGLHETDQMWSQGSALIGCPPAQNGVGDSPAEAEGASALRLGHAEVLGQMARVGYWVTRELGDFSLQGTPQNTPHSLYCRSKETRSSVTSTEHLSLGLR